MPVDSAAVQSLELAIEAEKTGIETYLDFAWQTRDSGGRAMFVRLARDEMEHLRLLERQKRTLEGSGCWQAVDVPGSLVEQVIPRLPETGLRIQGRNGLNQLSALQTALELEQRARTFYSDQGSTTGAEDARAMFSRLAEMEQAHAVLVQAEIDSIQQTGYWFSLPEFNLEGEQG